ncbi:MAG: response regulator, partial [Vicinamibacterales bacterium]
MKHVLLVDPDADRRAPLIVPFQKFGYRVSEAGTVEDGLIKLCQEALDVVVTELWLPGFDGLELARRMRSQPTRGYPSIVAFTEVPLTSSRAEQALRAGCDLVLAKAYLPWIFVARVDHLLQESYELRALARVAQERG